METWQYELSRFCRRDCEMMAGELSKKGLAALCYHAGITDSTHTHTHTHTYTHTHIHTYTYTTHTHTRVGLSNGERSAVQQRWVREDHCKVSVGGCE